MKPHHRSRWSRLFAVSTLVVVLGSPMLAAALRAQDRPSSGADDIEQMRNDIDQLKKGQEAIQKTLEEIKTLLRQSPPARPAAQAPPNVVLDLAGHPFQGAREAKLVVVEFSDYQCPYCARHTRETYPLIEKDFIATGKLRYAMLDFPLRNHPFAFKAAEAATCAADKGKFWEMHHLLFANQNALNPETLPTYAEQVGLDRAEFEACLEEGRQQSVNADMQLATRAGVSATPTFLVGWLTEGDRVKPVEMIRGAQSFDNFQRVLSKLLAEGPPAAGGE